MRDARRALGLFTTSRSPASVVSPATAPVGAPVSRRVVRPPGFVDGVRFAFDGVRFVLKTRWLWGFTLVPALLTAGLLAALVFLGSDWIMSRSPALASTQGRFDFVVALVQRDLGVTFLTPIVTVSLVVVSIVQPLSALALDILVRERAWKIGRHVWAADDAHDVPFRSLEATLCSLAVALPLLITLVLGASRYPRAAYAFSGLALLVSGFALAWNFIEYPLSHKDLAFGERLRWIWKHAPAVVGLGLTCAMITLIPVVGLIVVPAGVAAAARLMLECDRSDRRLRVEAAHRAAARGDLAGVAASGGGLVQGEARKATRATR